MRKFGMVLPFVVLAAACSQGANASRDGGPVGTRTIAATGFDAVSLEGPDDVRVVHGTAFSVVARGPEKELDRMDIRVDRSILKIGRKREAWGVRWGDSRGVQVLVTLPAIKAAGVAGSGNMTVDRADGADFDASVAGSGNLRIATIDAAKASFGVAGSGDLSVAGRVGAADVSVAGSGNLDAAQLTTTTSDVSIAGSGNARLRATRSATVSVIGSGDADIAGTTDCKVTKIGSGDARCTG